MTEQGSHGANSQVIQGGTYRAGTDAQPREDQRQTLCVSLADAEVVDQAARAVLNTIDVAGADDARRLGGQLAGAIDRGLRHPPLATDTRIVVSTEPNAPTFGDTIIVQVAGQLLGRRIHLTWKNSQGEQMTVALCPPGTDPCR